ncbi:MAG: hypothetical protein WD794_01915 [Mycobacteriales bacterium]
MKKLPLILGLTLVASLFATAPATASQQSQDQQDGTGGRFAVQEGHAHSSQYGTPSGKPTLFGTTPLEYDFEEGDTFSYSSAACEFDLPFNDTSLILGGQGYPDVESPAPAAYYLEGTVTETSGEGGTVEGTLMIIYCEEDEDGEHTIEGDRIFVDYQASFTGKSLNSMKLRDGTFQITGGTGRFADISGEGSFKGELTCLAGTLDNETVSGNPDNCAELGVFSDAVFNLRGSYQDPTVPTS